MLSLERMQYEVARNLEDFYRKIQLGKADVVILAFNGEHGVFVATLNCMVEAELSKRGQWNSIEQSGEVSFDGLAS